VEACLPEACPELISGELGVQRMVEQRTRRQRRGQPAQNILKMEATARPEDPGDLLESPTPAGDMVQNAEAHDAVEGLVGCLNRLCISHERRNAPSDAGPRATLRGSMSIP
jgi:hypothetical protein